MAGFVHRHWTCWVDHPRWLCRMRLPSYCHSQWRCFCQGHLVAHLPLWSGKTTVSILILWIWSGGDWINRLIEMCSWYQSQKGCFLTIFVHSFEGSKILCFYWLFMLWPFVCLHRRSLWAQHELCSLYRLKCKILSRYCNCFARREFPPLV